MDPFRIDVHHHNVPPKYVAALTALGVEGAGSGAFPQWEPAQSLAMMDRQGIRSALLSLSGPGVYFGDSGFATEMARLCNEYAADATRQAPSRFGFFAALPLPDVAAALGEVAYALDTLHADGVGLLTNYGGIYLGDSRLDPLFAELQRRRATVFIHPTISIGADIPTGRNPGSPIPSLPAFLLEFVFDTTRAVANLLFSETLARYPDITFILSHAGGTVPYLATKMAHVSALMGAQGQSDPAMIATATQARLAQLRRLYFDTALSANPITFASLLALAPANHVLFGSDFPWAPEQEAAYGIQSLADMPNLTTSVRAGIEREHALALFPRFASA